MKNFLSSLKIPTVLGLGIILFGIAAGVFLVLREQNIISQASPNITAQNINITNTTDDSITISWQTSTSVASFITYGIKNPNDQTVLDDRDSNSPHPYSIHYVTIKNLLPKTNYQYKILSGKISSDILNFTTAAPISSQTGFSPIIGSILDGEKPLDEGVVYLTIADSTVQSALIKTSGNFLIPISQIRKQDLSENFPLKEGSVAKLTIISARGSASILFKLKISSDPLSTVKLGQNIDLTANENLMQPSLNPQNLNKYDLNNDGKINAADNAIVLLNFGKNPKEKKADLNGDGIVDQKDLDLMSKQINQ